MLWPKKKAFDFKFCNRKKNFDYIGKNSSSQQSLLSSDPNELKTLKTEKPAHECLTASPIIAEI